MNYPDAFSEEPSFCNVYMKVVELKMFLMLVHDDKNLSNYLLTLESALVQKEKVKIKWSDSNNSCSTFTF